MEKNIQIFKSPEFGQIRTAGTQDEPLFCLADLCQALGISNSRNVKKRLDEDYVHEMYIGVETGVRADGTAIYQDVAMTFVNEGGMYDVIIRSNSPKAKPIRRWLTTEVIPAILRTGKYSVKGAEDNINQEFMTKMLNGMMEVSKNLTEVTKQLLTASQTKATTNYNPKVTPFVSMHKEPTSTVHPTPRFRALVNEMASILQTKRNVAKMININYGTLIKMTSEKPSRNKLVSPKTYEVVERRLMGLQRKLTEESAMNIFNFINTLGGTYNGK